MTYLLAGEYIMPDLGTSSPISPDAGVLAHHLNLLCRDATLVSSGGFMVSLLWPLISRCYALLFAYVVGLKLTRFQRVEWIRPPESAKNSETAAARAPLAQRRRGDLPMVSATSFA